MGRARLSIRVRLTLLYGGMFFLAGAAVVLASYLLVQSILADQVVPTAALPVSGPVGSEPVVRYVPGTVITKAELEATVAAKQQVLVDGTLSALLRFSVVTLAVVGVLAVGTGWLMAGRVLRPLHRITATARRVADRSLHQRIALDGPDDELKELADTFDAMLERLDAAFDGQRRFVANASHELRTPLAINRTLIEVATGRPDCPRELAALGDTLLEVNARHERLIDGLLTLARSEHELAERVAVDLAEVAAHVVDQARGQAGPGGVELRRAGSTAPTAGDPVLLERLVTNLVDNALRYNVPGGWVHVRTGTGAEGAWLAVDNTGPLVPGYAVPGLFEPFRRLHERTAGGGAGLGLSIVTSVAAAHGGTVTANARQAGGLTIRVTLPIATSVAPPSPPARPQAHPA